MPVVYVARRRLRVAGRDVMPGDDVPEANSWRHLPVYVHNGSVALVQTDVHYARGLHQRRPDTTRDDYRKLGMERWHGEIRYGASTPTPPDPPGPNSITLTYPGVSVGATATVNQSTTSQNVSGVDLGQVQGQIRISGGGTAGLLGKISARMQSFDGGADVIVPWQVLGADLYGYYPSASESFAVPVGYQRATTIVWTTNAAPLGSYPVRTRERDSGTGDVYGEANWTLVVA